jgi:hypothetical protein
VAVRARSWKLSCVAGASTALLNRSSFEKIWFL